MLNITEEFLIFLTKLAIKNDEQMSLNEVFHQFELRGVFLDQPSRSEAVKFYTKLNLIDKKSDSGDAQYVKRIL
jgi:DNA phosphorothioation-dependent restriction protein DptG